MDRAPRNALRAISLFFVLLAWRAVVGGPCAELSTQHGLDEAALTAERRRLLREMMCIYISR